MPIFLFSCRCGMGTFPQRLADLNNSIVVATEGYAFTQSTARGYQPGQPITITANERVDNTGEGRLFKIYLPREGLVQFGVEKIQFDPKTGDFKITFSAPLGTRIKPKPLTCTSKGCKRGG